MSLTTYLIRLVILGLVLFAVSCREGGLFHRKDEGIIIYEVTFPYEENSLMLELYPKQMMFEFKDDLYHSVLKSSYGVVSTEFIIDNDDKSFTQLLKSFQDKSYMTLEGDSISHWLNMYPKVQIQSTGQTDSIAGYLCEKWVAQFLNDSVPAITLYTTRDLKLNHGNWWNQFAEAPGFLMGYEVEQYGKRMKLIAKEVRFEEVPEEHFLIPEGYKRTDLSGMQQQINELMSSFGN